MRKLLLAVMLLILAKISVAQRFTISELTKITEMSGDSFNKYMLNKGYKPYNSDNDGQDTPGSAIFIQKAYEYDNGKANGKKFINKIAEANEPHRVEVNFATLSKDEYLAIKNQLKGSGFKYVRTVADHNVIKQSTIAYYVKEHFDLSLITEKIKKRTKNRDTQYTVSITKKNTPG